MVDKAPGDRKLSVPTKTLTLKPRVETGTVKQSFSHGRTKQVVVEKRGKRRVGGDAPATETHAPEPAVAKPAPAKAPMTRAATPSASPRSSSGVVLRTLTEDERSARASALADAKVRDVEERRLAEEEARRRNSKEGIEQAEREAAEARRKAEEERHRQDEEAKRKAELEAKKRFGEAEARAAAPARAAVPAARAPGIAADISDEDEGPRQVRLGPGAVLRPRPRCRRRYRGRARRVLRRGPGLPHGLRLRQSVFWLRVRPCAWLPRPDGGALPRPCGGLRRPRARPARCLPCCCGAWLQPRPAAVPRRRGLLRRRARWREQNAHPRSG